MAGTKTVTSRGLKKKIINPRGDLTKFVNDPYVFYSHFHAGDFSDVNTQIGKKLRLKASDKNSVT